MKWFSSDLHLFHKNVLKYCDRPFENTHFMHKAIIENYNNVVKEEDTVYFLGDLTMVSPRHTDKIKRKVDELPGEKHLILGNHDKFKPDSYLKIGFESVHTSLEIEIKGHKFFLVHDPKKLKQNMFGLFGHVHENFKMLKLENGKMAMNVGVDIFDFFPVSEDQVIKEFGL